MKNLLSIKIPILILLITSSFSCYIFEPTGTCIYGPEGYKVCINGTYKEECLEDYQGTWYEGQKCP